jgi:hypothetical protein
VVGLALAALGLLWALSSVGPKTTTVTPPVSTGNGGTTSTGGGNGTNTGSHFTGKPTWRTVTVDVLNGYGGTGAAGSAATTLSDAGWKVGTTGNASGITKTEVVYLSGFKAEALAVSKKLGLGVPIKIGHATGVVPASTNGVAIVLGPDGLPPL